VIRKATRPLGELHDEFWFSDDPFVWEKIWSDDFPLPESDPEVPKTRKRTKKGAGPNRKRVPPIRTTIPTLALPPHCTFAPTFWDKSYIEREVFGPLYLVIALIGNPACQRTSECVSTGGDMAHEGPNTGRQV
jgi:hypothetical protein